MRQIFVNLPVKDLERSKRFFQALGFSLSPEFTDDKAACVVVEQNAIHLMLLKDPDGHVWELVHMRSQPR